MSPAPKTETMAAGPTVPAVEPKQSAFPLPACRQGEHASGRKSCTPLGDHLYAHNGADDSRENLPKTMWIRNQFGMRIIRWDQRCTGGLHGQRLDKKQRFAPLALTTTRASPESQNRRRASAKTIVPFPTPETARRSATSLPRCVPQRIQPLGRPNPASQPTPSPQTAC